tara:strand:- start:667 stop:1281 length:615 start_codon:yes stop_codon:yes gene_type:complete
MKIYISSNFKKHFNTYIDFTDHYWIKYFDKKDNFFRLIPNSIKNLNRIIKDKKKIDLIILPGGNDLFGKDKLNKLRLKIEINLIKFGILNKIPILGVCRGMQVLNYHFGGKIKKIEGHMNTKHLINLNNTFFNKSQMKVNSFHNFCIPKKGVSKSFKILGVDQKDNIEMFTHKKYKIIGVMWHPERERNYNRLNLIIKNLIKKK